MNREITLREKPDCPGHTQYRFFVDHTGNYYCSHCKTHYRPEYIETEDRIEWRSLPDQKWLDREYRWSTVVWMAVWAACVALFVMLYSYLGGA